MKQAFAAGCLAIVLTACGSETPTPQADNADTPQAEIGEAPVVQDVALAAIPLSELPMPEFSEELATLVGSEFESLGLEVVETCIGHFDGFSTRFQGEVTAFSGYGWAWDTTNETAAAMVLLVDATGMVRGGLTDIVERMDVIESRAEVTSPMVGWSALIAAPEGELQAWVVDMEAGTACSVGRQQTPAI